MENNKLYKKMWLSSKNFNELGRDYILRHCANEIYKHKGMDVNTSDKSVNELLKYFDIEVQFDKEKDTYGVMVSTK